MTPERAGKLNKVLGWRQPDLTVVLENIEDPHNISAIMRSCDSVGIQDVLIVNTQIPRHKKWGFNSSRSANKWLTIHQFDSWEPCFEWCRQRKMKILTSHLQREAKSLFEGNFQTPTAFVFGNEAYGVTEEAHRGADGHFFIPQFGMIESLNVSVACAVTIYEACRQKLIAGHYQHGRLGDQQKQELQTKWENYSLYRNRKFWLEEEP